MEKTNRYRFDEEGQLLIICRKCLIEKHEDNFDRAISNSCGKSYLCKSCKKNPKPRLNLKEESIKIFEKLGYNVEENIHDQFIHRLKEKYNIHFYEER